MNPGDLDRRITLQQATQTRNANGEVIDTWSDYASRWAALDYGGGSDAAEADRLLAKSTVTFTVRYDARINKGMRIKYKHWYHNIIRLTELGRQDFLILDCETTDDEDLFTSDTTLVTSDSTLYTSDATRW